MNLFSKIPDNFFSILSSRSKTVYGVALLTLFDALTMYHNRIRKSDYIDLLKSRGEKELNTLDVEEIMDDDSYFKEPTLATKAGFIVRRLIETGWIVTETDVKTGCEYILLPSYSISMLKLIYEFVSDNQSRYVSYVHSTYADLSMEDEHQDEFMYKTLVSATNKTKELELEVAKLDHSIRVFHKQLANIFSPNEVLNQHFDVAREDIVDPIYHPLKTNDSIILYNGPINHILKKWLNVASVRDKLVEQCLATNYQVRTKAEAEQDIIKKINYIQDTYRRLALEIQEIDNAQSDYTKASTEKVIYLNNNDKTLKGKLETIFLAAARAINGDRASGVSMDVVKAMNNSIYLYQQGYIDEYSLTRPIKRNPKYDSEPMGIDDFEHESNEGLMQSLLTIADQYSDEKIMEFMDKAFQGNKEIDIKSIPIKDVEDFIMIILGSVKADSRYSFYELKRSDPMEQILKEDKYSMPNYGYARKEK